VTSSHSNTIYCFHRVKWSRLCDRACRALLTPICGPVSQTDDVTTRFEFGLWKNVNNISFACQIDNLQVSYCDSIPSSIGLSHEQPWNKYCDGFGPLASCIEIEAGRFRFYQTLVVQYDRSTRLESYSHQVLRRPRFHHGNIQKYFGDVHLNMILKRQRN